MHGLIDVDPVWRPLIAALAGVVEVTWLAPNAIERGWFPGRLEIAAPAATVTAASDICADPRAEAVEALRWARELLSRGRIAACDIALTAASPGAWDDHLLALSKDAGLLLHFSHGVPALSTRQGQACAALADVLVQGLSQPRIRRLLRRLPASRFRERLPENWWRMLPAEAGLFSVDHWREVLAPPRVAATAPPLLEVVDLVARGPDAAADAGSLLLCGQSRLLWEAALRIAPAEAIHISLGDLRVPDTRDPANSIAWCPATHLATSPRPHVRMLGLTSGTWPRAEGEDPILPDHVLPRRELESVSITERDRQIFAVIGKAGETTALSRGRRSASGTVQAASALWPHAGERTLTRTRIPLHAFSEADRLLACAKEAMAAPLVAASRQCWEGWRAASRSAHDGLRAHTRRLPSGARWPAHNRPPRSAGCCATPRASCGATHLDGKRPSSRSSRWCPVFGELVHELIRRAIVALEPAPGVARASETEIENAVQAAVEAVSTAWPLERAVPPPLLWRHTLEEAARLTVRGLTVDDGVMADTQSWTELAFGEEAAPHAAGLPWVTDQLVTLPGTAIRLRGRIDRVDLRGDNSAIRITDYKSGKAPKNAGNIVLAGGGELQRVLYAMTVRVLLPEVRMIVSRLAYLAGDNAPMRLQGEPLEAAMAEVAQFIGIASGIVRTGAAVPGPDADDPYHDLRLALPADRDVYLRRKNHAFREALDALAPLWGRP